MSKIYSRPRIRIPKMKINYIGTKKSRESRRKIIKITIILTIAFLTVKIILDAVYPIFNTLCENKAKSIATIISNEEATNVMKEHSYDEMFAIEKDSDDNITMIKSNIVVINEITSTIATNIQKRVNTEEREKIEIALRKFYRI